MAEMPMERNKKDAEKEKNTATLSKISNAIKGSEKLDVEGTDLLELLSHLEGELQARDVAIASLKSDQLKRVLYGCYKGSWRAGTPEEALQRDKTTCEDANVIEEDLKKAQHLADSQIAALQHVVEKQRVSARKMATCLRESERQRSSLVKELEEERAKHERDTAQGDDITYELEKERIRLRQDLEVEVAEKNKLAEALKESKSGLEEEKSRQKQIVLVLLADRKKLMKLYLEEKKRSEDLAQILSEEKGKMDAMAAGLEEESKRSLAMEAELEKHMTQFGSERQQLREKLVTDERRYRELEEALRKARADVEHFKKQLAEAHRVAMSQAGPPPAYPGPGPTPATAGVSVSPTPLSSLRQQSAAPQPNYANFPNYSTYSGAGPAAAARLGGSAVATTRPAGLSPGTGGHPVSRSQSGPITTAGQLQQTQTHTMKFHSNAYNTSTVTAGGFGLASHPAMIPAAGAMTAPLIDQDILPNVDINTYSQIGISKPAPHPAAKTTQSATATRKPLVDGSSTRKPALGKGVPPPLPPNKPVVPVKKELGKRGGGGGMEGKDLNLSVEGSGSGKPSSSGSGSSMVQGLQGLKFGLSITGTEPNKGIKELADSHAVPVATVPAKKFFNNIESKS